MELKREVSDLYNKNNNNNKDEIYLIIEKKILLRDNLFN
jgi:hypothetical protein